MALPNLLDGLIHQPKEILQGFAEMLNEDNCGHFAKRCLGINCRTSVWPSYLHVQTSGRCIQSCGGGRWGWLRLPGRRGGAVVREGRWVCRMVAKEDEKQAREGGGGLGQDASKRGGDGCHQGHCGCFGVYAHNHPQPPSALESGSFDGLKYPL